jgi:hypothetical protein
MARLSVTPEGAEHNNVIASLILTSERLSAPVPAKLAECFSLHVFIPAGRIGTDLAFVAPFLSSTFL